MSYGYKVSKLFKDGKDSLLGLAGSSNPPNLYYYANASSARAVDPIASSPNASTSSDASSAKPNSKASISNRNPFSPSSSSNFDDDSFELIKASDADETLGDDENSFAWNREPELDEIKWRSYFDPEGRIRDEKKLKKDIFYGVCRLFFRNPSFPVAF